VALWRGGVEWYVDFLQHLWYLAGKERPVAKVLVELSSRVGQAHDTERLASSLIVQEARAMRQTFVLTSARCALMGSLITSISIQGVR
jgi:hypothetical protein